MRNDSIRNTSVCVVGGAGFLGSHLVNYLIDDRDCRVLVIDNLCAGKREFVHPKAAFEHHDIVGSEEYLRALLWQYAVEWVFNYAAIPFVPSGFKKPLETFNATATAALNVLVACEKAEVKGLLQVGSAEIYGNSHGRIKETDTVEPHSTYGVSKASADWLVQARWREVQQRAIVMRQFNCYGPRPTWPYVIPEIIMQLLKGNTVKLGNNTRRDFQYAEDAVRMAVELLERGEWGTVYNMGSEESILIYDLAKMIGEIIGHEEVCIETDQSRVRNKDVEIWHLCSDSSKLYATIATRPEVSMREGLRKMVEWFKNHGECYESCSLSWRESLAPRELATHCPNDPERC